MERIDSHEVAKRMREAADLIDQHDTIPMDSRIELTFYWVDTKEKLAAWVRMMSGLKADSNNGHHWVKGTIGNLQVTLYYSAGLLAPTTVETVKEVRTESGKADFAKLLAETQPVVPDAAPAELAVDM
jgi:hypothetical protein